MAKNGFVAEVTFQHQPHRVVKYAQTICRMLPTNCLSVFDHFMGLALKGFKLFPLSIKHMSFICSSSILF